MTFKTGHGAGVTSTCFGGQPRLRIFLSLVAMLPSIVLALGPGSRPGELSEPGAPEILNEVGITERLEDKVSLGLEFRDENGFSVRLSEIFSSGKPVLLNLAYYECPMLCNLVMNGLLNGIKGSGWTPGQEFEVLTLSIDPEEGHELASAKKQTYIENLGLLGAEKGWHFWTGSDTNIRELTRQVGFGYALDSISGEYAHAAVLITLSPTGKITRYLYGTEYKGKDLRLALLEAKDEKSTSIGEKILLLCYSYDANSNSYVLLAHKSMRAAGFLFMIGIVGVFGSLWYKDVKRKSTKISDAA